MNIASDSQNYIFVSYSHRDSNLVKQILSFLTESGFHLWFDENICAASEWTNTLANRIIGCKCFLAFTSKHYCASEFCKDEWSFAKMQNKPFLIVRLDSEPFPSGMTMQAVRFQQLFYQDSPAFYDALTGADKIASCRAGDATTMSPPPFSLDLRPYIKSLADWLICLPVRWGTSDRSTDAQNANTCEGLLALKAANYDVLKPTLYQQTFQSLLAEATPDGLASKSLGNTTTVCTAMLLYLASMETCSDTDLQRLHLMAQHLWEACNPTSGWGVYCERMPADTCSNVNTCWALLALNQYPFIAETEAFRNFCSGFLETNSDGTFGFYTDGASKLTPTAMGLCLYYCLDKPVQTFDKKAAIDFIFRHFVEQDIQAETEILYGIEKETSSVKKAPWNHITVGAVISALALAYQAEDLAEHMWKDVLRHMKAILQQQVFVLENNRALYRPRDMEQARSGNYTFPTAYLLWALCMIQKAQTHRQHHFNNRES